MNRVWFPEWLKYHCPFPLKSSNFVAIELMSDSSTTVESKDSSPFTNPLEDAMSLISCVLYAASKEGPLHLPLSCLYCGRQNQAFQFYQIQYQVPCFLCLRYTW